ncbi:hypothetical protein [Microbacterium capsulatum]|uniref:Uncharacterized protein n=1 Tax=Microbacterium capsulatum TaxID=3041921 RepID=A0ABU0XHL8_9MICO|nr:hypothetical protein [Microbacterium sp. ASV81]MDQ4214630.1 hypothetical protein [Microbacterium sp. ASV81]
MTGLDARDRALVRTLIGEMLADQDEAAVASAIEDLRAGLPAFRRDAARVLAEEAAR